MDVRGISHHIDHLSEERAAADMCVIREELHCTAVMPIGSDLARLRAASQAALTAGLAVWIRPQRANRPVREQMAHLAGVAAMAEELRVAHPGRVTLLVGTEFSLTAPGLLPGRGEFVRIQIIRRPRLRRLFERRMNRRLAALLARACEVAREHFSGPLTYGAGPWEDIDWSRFDVAGINLYRQGRDTEGYARRLRELTARLDRPLVITEFGCGAYQGAEVRGAGSFFAVNWFADPPRLRKGIVRDESVQARYLVELLHLYQEVGVHGAFVFTFTMPDFPHHEDPAFDLDAAGFGVVRPTADLASWVPKEAFHAVADQYAAGEG
ncbi:hypothetical protein JQS43_07635 [Natronosporangium hydrolyticum]|uniref:Abortive infection protein n=1 Tax=Natronosporangium hydrolyticum TaxID=2811111 RepID=A0A895YLH6_9ACTN|nr:hypothetical protein [Natronosporangium hydrolyticum]QSB16163.1 hypothetical protein JQS43_07635 [Natronosporangium hydrolyticum]